MNITGKYPLSETGLAGLEDWAVASVAIGFNGWADRADAKRHLLHADGEYCEAYIFRWKDREWFHPRDGGIPSDWPFRWHRKNEIVQRNWFYLIGAEVKRHEISTVVEQLVN